MTTEKKFLDEVKKVKAGELAYAVYEFEVKGERGTIKARIFEGEPWIDMCVPAFRVPGGEATEIAVALLGFSSIAAQAQLIIQT